MGAQTGRKVASADQDLPIGLRRKRLHTLNALGRNVAVERRVRRAVRVEPIHAVTVAGQHLPIGLNSKCLHLVTKRGTDVAVERSIGSTRISEPRYSHPRASEMTAHDDIIIRCGNDVLFVNSIPRTFDVIVERRVRGSVGVELCNTVGWERERARHSNLAVGLHGHVPHVAIKDARSEVIIEPSIGVSIFVQASKFLTRASEMTAREDVPAGILSQSHYLIVH